MIKKLFMILFFYLFMFKVNAGGAENTTLAVIEKIADGGSVSIFLCVPSNNNLIPSMSLSYSHGVDVYLQSKVEKGNSNPFFYTFQTTLNRKLFVDERNVFFTLRFKNSSGEYVKTERIDAMTLINEFTSKYSPTKDLIEKDICALATTIQSVKTYKEMPIKM